MTEGGREGGAKKNGANCRQGKTKHYRISAGGNQQVATESSNLFISFFFLQREREREREERRRNTKMKQTKKMEEEEEEERKRIIKEGREKEKKEEKDASLSLSTFLWKICLGPRHYCLFIAEQ